MVLKIADQRQRIGALIHLAGCQLKILVDQLHTAGIHHNPLRSLYLDSHFGMLADTLSQLQQEVPCRSVCIVPAWQQSHQRLDFFGDRDPLHVHRKGIENVHGNAGFVDVVNTVAPGTGIGDQAVPSQHTVAAGNIIKVEGCLTCLVQVNSEHHCAAHVRLTVL